ADACGEADGQRRQHDAGVLRVLDLRAVADEPRGADDAERTRQARSDDEHHDGADDRENDLRLDDRRMTLPRPAAPRPPRPVAGNLLLPHLVAPTRIPLATYRLQFNGGFTFRQAHAIVDYLHDLGISDCYASSYLKAVPGSSHGYDVADPTQLNPEIGTDADHAAWTSALRTRGMGHVMDIVPNHMGIAKSANPWWLDVLENGPSSRFARFFDIEWHPVKDELAEKLLIPILGDQYGEVLENQELTLAYRDGAFFVRYYE